MTLYHFTALEYLKSILDEGITHGDVPLSPTKGVNAVWLTSDPDPTRTGVGGGARLLTDEERAAYAVAFPGRKAPGPGARWPDKSAVMLVVEVPDDDRLLVPWARYASMRGVKREWRRTLERAAGGPDGARCWYLYRGTVAREWITGVVPLSEKAREILNPDHVTGARGLDAR